jgi:hypothetical protein
MGLDPAFSRPGAAPAGKKRAWTWSTPEGLSKEEDETVKPDALPDLTPLLRKTDARMALQRNQKVSERAGNLCDRGCTQTARLAAKLHRFDTGTR